MYLISDARLHLHPHPFCDDACNTGNYVRDELCSNGVHIQKKGKLLPLKEV